jgi:hypothetical protein
MHVKLHVGAEMQRESDRLEVYYNLRNLIVLFKQLLLGAMV